MSTPSNVFDLVQSLSPDEIQSRIDEIDAEKSALQALLRAARARDRTKRSQRRNPIGSPPEPRTDDYGRPIGSPDFMRDPVIKRMRDGVSEAIADVQAIGSPKLTRGPNDAA